MDERSREENWSRTERRRVGEAATGDEWDMTGGELE
jgi:hypothetical protein